MCLFSKTLGVSVYEVQMTKLKLREVKVYRDDTANKYCPWDLNPGFLILKTLLLATMLYGCICMHAHIHIYGYIYIFVCVCKNVYI